MVECIPAAEGVADGMGSLVQVDDGRLHEECCTYERDNPAWKELHESLQLVMAQTGEYEVSWVKDCVGQFCTQIGEDRFSQQL